VALRHGCCRPASANCTRVAGPVQIEAVTARRDDVVPAPGT
jgi:hypothetical protein